MKLEKPLTPEQQEKALRIVYSVAASDGCSFLMSRKFAGGTCAQENGRGFSCNFCEAMDFMKELGIKVHR